MARSTDGGLESINAPSLQGLQPGSVYTSSLRADTTSMYAESPQHRLSRASYAASEGRPASSTDCHLESASDSMGYWTTNGAAQEYSQPQAHSLGNELLYGLINTCVSIPAMISFAAIIFQVQPEFQSAAARVHSGPLCFSLCAANTRKDVRQLMSEGWRL